MPLRRVARYFVRLTRLAHGKPNGSANEEMGDRFSLDVLEDADAAVAGIKRLPLPGDLSRASQEDFRSLTDSFDLWAEGVLGDALVAGAGADAGDWEVVFQRGDVPDSAIS